MFQRLKINKVYILHCSYKCSGQNSLGKAEKQITIQVIGKFYKYRIDINDKLYHIIR